MNRLSHRYLQTQSLRTHLVAAIVAMLACAACGTDPAATADATPNVQTDTSAVDATGDDSGTSDAAPSDTTGTDKPDTTGLDLGPDAELADTVDNFDAAPKPDAQQQDATVDVKKPDGGASTGDFQELLVKVLGPSGRDWVQNEGQNIQVSGVAFGGAETLTWSIAPGGKTGVITPATYWVTGIIALEPGDNVVTVSATKGGQTAVDTVHITYNPFFSFDGAPAMAPDLAFVGQSSTVVVRMSLPAATPGADGTSIVDPTSITLIEVDDSGKSLSGGVTSKLVDNGQGSNCDDVQKDAVYSACVSFTPSTAKTMFFRVKATVNVFGKKYDAISPVTVVDVVAKFDKGECKSIVSLQKKVKADYLAALAGSGPAAAQLAAIAALESDASVAEAGPASQGFGVWVRYKTGRLGALNLAPAGIRAGGAAPGEGSTSTAALPTYSVGTRRALALAPFNGEFKVDGAGDEAEEAGNALKDKQCPPFAVDIATGNEAYLKYYREMSTYGIIAITGHGDVYFEGMDTAAKQAAKWEHLGAQEVIWSGEAVNCEAMSTGASGCNKQGVGCPAGQSCIKTSVNGGTCVDHTQGGVMTGRAIIGDEVYGLTPAFIQRHTVEPFPASIVYLGACRSMYNGSMAVELFGNGAAAVLGFSGYVTNKFAYQQGHALVDGLVNGGLSTLQAMNAAEDPDHSGSRMRMIGNGKSNVKEEALINPSWDLGKLTGWKAVGDGRVISRLGATIPVAGKYMGIISTGLGFTAQTGSLEQPFCIPQSKTQMCYYWKFYSEEFKEFCGSSFMDRFTSTLQADTGKLTMTDVWIDQLCPYDCGGKSPCDQSIPGQCKCGQQWKTLSKADVIFDVGDVWMTPWQKQCTDVTPLAGAGKKATLKFYATDTGDSIYDTVVLIDEITVE